MPKQRISDREYRAAQRGQEKLDARNCEILDAGATPRRTKFQTQKQLLRDAISECVDKSTSFEQFRAFLFSRYQIKIKESRGRISYQTARGILRSYTPEGKFPSLKSLQSRKSELQKMQKTLSTELDALRKNERTISIASQNVHFILEGSVERVPAAHRDWMQIT